MPKSFISPRNTCPKLTNMRNQSYGSKRSHNSNYRKQSQKSDAAELQCICFPLTINMKLSVKLCVILQNTEYTQKKGEVSKVNKKFISHLTRAQHTPSAAATVQVSHVLPAVRFSCLLRGQFPRWRHSRKRLSVCSVLRCPDL